MKIFLLLFSVTSASHVLVWIKNIDPSIISSSTSTILRIRVHEEESVPAKELVFSKLKQNDKAIFLQQKYLTEYDAEVVGRNNDFVGGYPTGMDRREDSHGNFFQSCECRNVYSTGHSNVVYNCMPCCIDFTNSGCSITESADSKCPSSFALNPKVHKPSHLLSVSFTKTEEISEETILRITEKCRLVGYVAINPQVVRSGRTFILPIYDITTIHFRFGTTFEHLTYDTPDTELSKSVSIDDETVTLKFKLSPIPQDKPVNKTEVFFSAFHKADDVDSGFPQTFHFCCVEDRRDTACGAGYGSSSLIDAKQTLYTTFPCYISQDEQFLLMHVYKASHQTDDEMRHTFEYQYQVEIFVPQDIQKGYTHIPARKDTWTFIPYSALINFRKNVLITFKLLTTTAFKSATFCTLSSEDEPCEHQVLTFTQNVYVYSTEFDKPVSYISINIDGQTSALQFRSHEDTSFVTSFKKDPNSKTSDVIITVKYEVISDSAPRGESATIQGGTSDPAATITSNTASENSENEECSCSNHIKTTIASLVCGTVGLVGIGLLKLYTKYKNLGMYRP